MSDKQTTALILLFIVAFLFYLYNKGLLGTITGLVTGKPVKPNPVPTQVGGYIPPMPVGSGTGLTTIPGTTAVPYTTATTNLSGGNNILLSQNTVNNAQLANQSGLIPVWSYDPGITQTNIPAPASNDGQLNKILNGWETLAAVLGL